MKLKNIIISVHLSPYAIKLRALLQKNLKTTYYSKVAQLMLAIKSTSAR